MKQALRAELLADAAVAALVGDRLSWQTRVQGEDLPAGVLIQIGRTPDYSFAGATGFVESRVQIDALAESYAEAEALGDAIEAVLSGQSFSRDGHDIQGAFLDRRFDDDDQSGPRPIFRTVLDFRVLHAPTA